MVDPLERMRSAVEEYGSVANFARRSGLSAQYLHDVMAGRRGPSDRLLNALGLEKIVVVSGEQK